jgi:Family of unknown function (DUF6527)
MKAVLRKNALFFECPAKSCGLVRVPIKATPGKDGPIWSWNGSLDKPTLTPSVRISWDFSEGRDRKHNCCHFHVIDGVFHFHADCTHELKGQKVPMPDVTDEFTKSLPAD